MKIVLFLIRFKVFCFQKSVCSVVKHVVISAGLELFRRHPATQLAPGVVSGAQLRHGSLLRSHDVEGTHGADGQ